MSEGTKRKPAKESSQHEKRQKVVKMSTLSTTNEEEENVEEAGREKVQVDNGDDDKKKENSIDDDDKKKEALIDDDDDDDFSDDDDNSSDEDKEPTRFALVCLSDSSSGDAHPLITEIYGSLQTGGGGNTIGSSSWVEDSDERCHLFVDDISIDLIHCHIRQIYDQRDGTTKCFIRDGWNDGRPSRTGTFVNGCPVSHKNYLKLDVLSVVTLGLDKEEQTAPRFKLVNMENFEDQRHAIDVLQDIKAIVWLSSTAARMSGEARDREHVKNFQNQMQNLDDWW